MTATRRVLRVLCPVDFSPASASGLAVGCSLANALGAELLLIHVIEFPHRSVATERLYLEVEDEAGRRLRQALESGARSARGQFVVLRGKPSEQIVQFAEEQDVSFIVMPTHGRTGVDRLLSGSVTERVLRSSHATVVAVPPNTGPEALAPGPVMFAVDFSAPSDGALPTAVAIAKALGTGVHLVHVLALAPAHEQGQGWRFPILPADIEDAEIIAAEDDLEQRANQVRTLGVAATTRMVRGTHRALELVEAAAAAGACLIVVASHGDSAVTRALLGSTCEKLVRISGVPVMVVPSPSH